MAFTPSKAKKNLPKKAEMPNLTSMMDLMTIILLFLLKSLSVSGALLHQAQGIELPLSKIHMDPELHLSFIINSHGVFKDLEGQTGDMVADADELANDDLVIFEHLKSYLDSERQLDKELGRKQREIITIQGDKNIQYRHLFKFITTCGQAGFSTIQFIVEKEG